MKKTFGVIGGDGRQAKLATLLREDGAIVHTYGVEGEKGDLEQALDAEVILLPLPLCKEDGLLNCKEDPMVLAELFARLTPRQRILAGQVKPQQQAEAAQYGLILEDYFLREELTVANAAATAECALRVAMEQLDRSLLGENILVLGFGRIGKLLCHRLQGLGCRVTATARKNADLAWIRAYGYEALKTDEGDLAPFGVVFNTIPALVLDRARLAQLPPGSLCVDLASKNGIDPGAAKELGLSYIWARFLPGRMVPHTAAAAIRETIYHILSEERGESL